MTAAPNLGAALGVRNFIALLTEINTAITRNNFKIEHIPGLEELALCQLGLCNFARRFLSFRILNKIANAALGVSSTRTTSGLPVKVQSPAFMSLNSESSVSVAGDSGEQRTKLPNAGG
jgi:hypothetical protein